MTSQQIMKS